MNEDEEIVPFLWVKSVFRRSTVWVNADCEMLFYQWLWNLLAKKLNVVDFDQATIDAITLVYVYNELCYHVTGQEFHEDTWDLVEERCEMESLNVGFLCGKIADAQTECPESEKRALQWLIRTNHQRIAEVLSAIQGVELWLSIHLSLGRAVKIAIDENGDEEERPLVETYEQFCRYISDEGFRSADINGVFEDEYQSAYEWLHNGAEMLEAR